MNYFASVHSISQGHSMRSDNLRCVIGFNEYFMSWGTGHTFTEVIFRKQISTLRVRQRKYQANRSDHLKYMIHPSPACNRVCTVCRLCAAVRVALASDSVSFKYLL